jgi:hypothetical protein
MDSADLSIARGLPITFHGVGVPAEGAVVRTA